jgi:hypothetical protein
MCIHEDDDVEVDYEFHNDVAFVQIELGLEEEDVEEVQGLSQIWPNLQALNSPNMWIGDTGSILQSISKGESTQDLPQAGPEEYMVKQLSQTWR